MLTLLGIATTYFATTHHPITRSIMYSPCIIPPPCAQISSSLSLKIQAKESCHGSMLLLLVGVSVVYLATAPSFTTSPPPRHPKLNPFNHTIPTTTGKNVDCTHHHNMTPKPISTLANIKNYLNTPIVRNFNGTVGDSCSYLTNSLT